MHKKQRSQKVCTDVLVQDDTCHSNADKRKENKPGKVSAVSRTASTLKVMARLAGPVGRKWRQQEGQKEEYPNKPAGNGVGHEGVV